MSFRAKTCKVRHEKFVPSKKFLKFVAVKLSRDLP